MSEEMPTLYVPDLYSSRWPAERLKLYIMVHDWLEIDKGDEKSLHTTLQLGWEMLGKGNADKMPVKGPVPQVDLKNYKVRSALFEDYVNVNDALKKALDKMLKRDAGVAEKVDNSKVSVETARGGYKQLIPYLNTQAETPPTDMDENRHVMTYVTHGCEKSLEIITTAKGEQEETADGIKGDADEMAKELDDRIKKLEQASGNPGGYPPNVDGSNWPTTGSTDQTTPPAIDNSDFPPGLDGLDDGSNNDSLTPPDLDGTGTDPSGVNSPTPGGIDPSGPTTPGVTTPATPSVPSTPATSPMGSGMDMMSSMLPMMMQQAMMRNMADQDLNSRRRDLDPSRYDDELDAVAPPPVAPPVTAQPAVAQPSTTASTTQHSGAPTGTASSTQPTVAPGRTPGADGSVEYTFPDGRTQKVSAMVAQALDAAFGNRSATDAQKAYEKTSAKWSDKKQIGTPVDPFQLMTGDVAVWEKRTAILVVFPSDDGVGTLEAIVDGELKPCNPPEMTDKAGEFGSFTGFVHPKGIEVTAPEDGGAPPATPGSADQSASAAMPVVAAG